MDIVDSKIDRSAFSVVPSKKGHDMATPVGENLSCDVWVIGCGDAGLRAAIASGVRGCDVLVLSKGAPGKGTSTLLSGGVFAGSKEGRPPDNHREQTLEAGRGINDPVLVDILTGEAPTRLRELVGWGIGGEMRDGYLFSNGRPPVWGEPGLRLPRGFCLSET